MAPTFYDGQLWVSSHGKTNQPRQLVVLYIANKQITLGSQLSIDVNLEFFIISLCPGLENEVMYKGARIQILMHHPSDDMAVAVKLSMVPNPVVKSICSDHTNGPDDVPIIKGCPASTDPEPAHTDSVMTSTETPVDDEKAPSSNPVGCGYKGHDCNQHKPQIIVQHHPSDDMAVAVKLSMVPNPVVKSICSDHTNGPDDVPIIEKCPASTDPEPAHTDSVMTSTKTPVDDEKAPSSK
ncbi:hypothetical protein F2Q70_00030867 [Brassica cretica]|uniref:Uncharacterized protein n=1 Tax=Brassica cretica TaxID=69181 RepID=A0A8S9FER6_BRACR|nr:hypothetical protein F2Q70_00030867 [Brassica cretica]